MASAKLIGGHTGLALEFIDARRLSKTWRSIRRNCEQAVDIDSVSVDIAGSPPILAVPATGAGQNR
jgi:hypothetical protein